MTFKRKALGQLGEDLACNYLQKKGYHLVGRNIRLFCGEIDLLFQDKDTFVICEVKTKSSQKFGSPQEEVDFFKQRKLINLARAILQKYPEKSVRIDVVAIYSETGEIEHIISAVEE